jgi:uncharacterized protein YaaQ
MNPVTPIHNLITAIIQVQDAEDAISALTGRGISVNQLASTGGFLGRGNVTLLIGIQEGQEALVIGLLSETCRRRVEYVSTPLEGSPFHLPLPTPITVGGATVFSLAVEYYEEIP